MKSKILRLLAVGLLFGPVGANATAISYGALSSNDDGSTQIITDSLNNREWLRWNGPQLGMTYAQTLAAIAPGGSLEGWSIARNADAQLFSDALLYGQSNACDTSNTVACKAGLPTTLTSLLGNSYFTGSWVPYDYAFFLSDNAYGYAAGLIEYNGTGSLTKWNEWGHIVDADLYARAYLIPWILYRSASVPEPGTLALLGLGLLGLGVTRRKAA